MLALGSLTLKRINPHLIYTFGRRMSPLEAIVSGDAVSDRTFVLWMARLTLYEWSRPDSPLLGSARRAVSKLIAAIDGVVPRDVQEAFTPSDKVLDWGDSNAISIGLKDLESVLSNEMPDIAMYSVSQKGIFRTDDLIERADHHLTSSVRTHLPDQARKDLLDAGRCLAYELPVACTFHLWRAVETVIQAYLLELSGKKLEEMGISKNWGAYIKALKEAGAPTPVTAFLEHIRSAYRNPHTHPDVVISVEDAQRLFAVATSAIDQMEELRSSLLLQRIFPEEPRSESAITVPSPVSDTLSAQE